MKEKSFALYGSRKINSSSVMLLTNVSYKEVITVEEDGLSVIFSTAARAQSCPSPLPDQAQIAALACKFTLLPAQGSYGERQKDIRA